MSASEKDRRPVSASEKDRRRALDLLFEVDQRARAGASVDLATLLARRRSGADALKPLRERAVTIVEGVIEHQDRIDDLIATHSHGWTLDRMPAVDRCILRMGVWELLYDPETEDAYAVKGATDLAAELSTDDSADFVNGLLGQLQRLAPTLRDGTPPPEATA